MQRGVRFSDLEGVGGGLPAFLIAIRTCNGAACLVHDSSFYTTVRAGS